MPQNHVYVCQPLSVWQTALCLQKAVALSRVLLHAYCCFNKCDHIVILCTAPAESSYTIVHTTSIIVERHLSVSEDTQPPTDQLTLRCRPPCSSRHLQASFPRLLHRLRCSSAPTQIPARRSMIIASVCPCHGPPSCSRHLMMRALHAISACLQGANNLKAPCRST